jgi:hypothetical protein
MMDEIVHLSRWPCKRQAHRRWAERRAAPKPARIPLGDRLTYSSDEGLVVSRRKTPTATSAAGYLRENSMSDIATTLDAVPTSFGTLKPVGHALLALADAESEERLLAGLREAGFDQISRIAPSETQAELEHMIDNASGASGFGYEIVLMKRYLELAKRGCRWVLVKVDRSDDAARVGELARLHGALSAVHYRRLVEEDLL